MADSSPITVISLDEKKLHNVSDIIFSDETHRILKLLEKRACTEIELEKKLFLHGAKVHRVLSGLLDAGILVSREAKRKGHSVNIYKIAPSHLIILPSVKRSLFSRFRQLIPVLTVVVVATGIVQVLNQSGLGGLAEVVDIDAKRSALTVAANTPTGELSFQIAPWFLIGAIFAILVFVVYDIWKEKIWLGAK